MMNRIKKFEKLESEVSYEMWEVAIKQSFPMLLTPAKIGLSMISQLLLKDVSNAGAIILIGSPASGKTLTINLFNGLKDFAYSADSFTAKSFVTGAANVKTTDLDKIDLLPKIRHKLFLVRDMAPMFSLPDEQLQEVLGRLTRLFDGEGYSFESGVHGHRGYEGDQLFFMMGATTPIHNRVWKVSGNLGPRMLFYRMKALHKSKEQLIVQLGEADYKSKEYACNLVTGQFLETLWHRHQDGIDWDKASDPKEIMEHIVLLGMMLAKLRGLVKEAKEDMDDLEVGTENPDRLCQWFYNLARGHAVSEHRTHLEKRDLSIIAELAIDSGSTLRSRLFRLLIEHSGSMTTTEIMSSLGKSQTTVLKLTREFKVLGLADIKPTLADKAGRPENALCLMEEWNWFLSEEFKGLLSNG